MSDNSQTKLFNQSMFDALAQKAEQSARLRSNQNVHESLDDSVQRLFITITPGSYVQPHLHQQTDKWEFFWMVSGELSMLVFDQDGTVLERHELSANGPLYGLEIPANTWHAVVVHEQPATFFEVKTGPYIAMDDKAFASWAPRESSDDAQVFLERFRTIQPGENAVDAIE